MHLIETRLMTIQLVLLWYCRAFSSWRTTNFNGGELWIFPSIGMNAYLFEIRSLQSIRIILRMLNENVTIFGLVINKCHFTKCVKRWRWPHFPHANPKWKDDFQQKRYFVENLFPLQRNTLSRIYLNDASFRVWRFNLMDKCCLISTFFSHSQPLYLFHSHLFIAFVIKSIKWFYFI